MDFYFYFFICFIFIVPLYECILSHYTGKLICDCCIFMGADDIMEFIIYNIFDFESYSVPSLRGLGKR